MSLAPSANVKQVAQVMRTYTHHDHTGQHHVVNATEVPMKTVFPGHNPYIPCSVSKEPAVWQCAVQSGAVMCPGVNAMVLGHQVVPE